MANVASLMSGATVLHMGKLAIGAKASITSKLYVVPRLQPRRPRALHRSKKSQLPRRGSTGSYNGQGKGGGNRQHQKKKSPKKPPKQNAYAVTMKNSVPSEVTTTSGGEREKQGNVSSKTVLSGPEEEGTYNRFSCFAVHSKMSQSTNAKGKPMEGLYTDTDPDDRSEIIVGVSRGYTDHHQGRGQP